MIIAPDPDDDASPSRGQPFVGHPPVVATPERFSFAWQATLTREAFLDQVPTSGGHNRIRADLLQELLAGLGRVIDENGGNATMHYTTVGLVARR